MKRYGLAAFFIALAIAVFSAGMAVKHQIARAEGPQGIRWAGLASPFRASESQMEPQEVFEAVLQAIGADYVEKITDQKKLTYGAIDAMVDALHDPYSRFLTPERRKVLEEAQTGRFHGLGAIAMSHRVRHKDLTYERLLIANVLPGSPAEKAGLSAGDIITKIDAKHVFQLPYDILPEDVDPETVKDLLPTPKDEDDLQLLNTKEALEALGQDGKTVTLTILRTNQPKPLEKKVTLGLTTVPTISSRMAEAGVGILTIPGFTRNSSAAITSALGELGTAGARSLVIDLRGNYGGSLEEAKRIASLFAEGPLGYVVRRNENRQPIEVTGTPAFKGNVVLLVNHSTIGIGELLAAALSERLKAPIVGAPTFGDGLDQTLIPLDDGSAIQLTTGRFLTTTGVDFNRKGIRPTNLILDSPEKQMQTALALAKAPDASRS